MPRRVKIAEVDHEYKNAPSKESLRYCIDFVQALRAKKGHKGCHSIFSHKEFQEIKS